MELCVLQDSEGIKWANESKEAIKDLSILRLNARKEHMVLKMFSGHTETEVTPKEQCVIPLHTDFFFMVHEHSSCLKLGCVWKN